MGKQRYFELRWPSGGLSEHQTFSRQEQSDVRSNQLPTSVDAENVRNYDQFTGRLRGSQRCGTTKYVPGTLNSGAWIQHINHIVMSSYFVSSGGSALRTLKAVGVAGGTVKSFTTAGYGATVNGAGALDATARYINSAELFGRIYFADGVNYKYWDPSTDEVYAWTATAGAPVVPIPSNGTNLAQLICQWRGRIVISGFIGDRQNWAMSRLGDAHDWDIGATPVDETMSVWGNNAETGKCADAITCLIPYSDDILIFGGDHSIWQMTNDPMAGGRIDLVSDSTGIAFGTAWCKDPSGLVYFFGSRGGLYVMVPGSLPKRLSSERIEERLAGVDLSTHVVRLGWNDREQIVHLFITNPSGQVDLHYAYDVRNNAFWPDSFRPGFGHNPTAVHVMDGDAVDDRVMLLGCVDGSIRQFDLDAKSDDGVAILSYVYLGPIQAGQGVNIRLQELRAELGADSDDLIFSVFDGPNAEAAFAKATPRFQGVWSAGVNLAEQRKAINGALYLALESDTLDTAWQLESILAATDTTGRAAGRGSS